MSPSEACACGGTLQFELIEQTIEISAIEHERGALVNRSKLRAPMRIERSSLHAHVSDCIGIGQTSVHLELHGRCPTESSVDCAVRRSLAYRFVGTTSRLQDIPELGRGRR